MQPWMMMLAAVVGGYLLGSIPFGILAARMGGLGDLRQIGSGNIGATNVLRTGRKDLALFTLIGDSGKGVAAVLIAKLLTDDPAVIALAGAAAFTGHLFPVRLKFKGGKGVATFLGVLLAAWWPAGLAACAVWLAMAFALRYSSLAALTAAALSPMLVFLLDGPYAFMYLAAFMALLIFVRHRENIRRLLRNEEPKIGRKTPPA